MKIYPIVFVLLFSFLISCSSEQQADPQQIAATEEVQTPDFEAIISGLQDQQQTEQVKNELEQAHYNYGVYLIYNTDPSQMRVSANKALRQFISVLRINPDNEKAMAEIDQIMSIYASFPDRSPDEEIVQELRDLGFNY